MVPLPNTAVHEVLGGGKGLLAGGGLGLLGLATTAVKAFETIPENHAGLKLSWGRATRQHGKHTGELRKVVPAGRYAVAPFAHSYVSIYLGPRKSSLEGLQVRRQGKQYQLDGSVIWAVRPDYEHTKAEANSMYRARFNAPFNPKAPSDVPLEEIIGGICLGQLHDVGMEVDLDNIDNRAILQTALKEKAGSELDYYGVYIRSLNLAKSGLANVQQMFHAGLPEGGLMLGGDAESGGPVLHSVPPIGEVPPQPAGQFS